jgi:hypothetical protein
MFVGLFPILILDLDGNNNSADKMMTAVEDWRVFAEYTDEIPADLGQYQTIFLCLGTYSSNHVLSESEAAPFISFLNNGGNLYMEGADTWYYDQLYNASSLHPMFNITGLSDGASDLVTINGVAGTMTEGMSFYFSGENNYIDRIQPVAPAYTIFNNNSPAYQAAVAFDAGTYKTIGSVFEFGGLMDNQNNSRKNLMKHFLDFFGMDPISEIPETPEGEATVCANTLSGIYSTKPVSGANYYIWELNPPDAGTVEGWDTAVTVNWTPGYIGPSTLRVCGMNQTGLGPLSASLLINHVNAPTAVAAFSETEICAGDTTWASITLTGTTPWYLMISLGGNVVPMFSNKPNMNSIPFNPTADIEVTIQSVTDGTGCTTTGFPTAWIKVLPLPSTPAKPSGLEYVGLLTGTQSVYTIPAADSAESYTWTLDPAEAGALTVSENGLECSIDWASTFTGQVSLKVKGLNECGEGYDSDPLAITVANTYGVGENESGPELTVFPNPNSGSFQLTIKDLTDIVSVRVINSTGEVIFREDDVEISGKHSKIIDLSVQPAGVYYLRVEGQHSMIDRKIVLQR